MKRDLALRILGEILQWRDDEAETEFGWLRLMSRIKYDGYSEFLAGARFLESLASWLQQFEPGDRRAAYGFVRRRLIYVSAREIQRLIEGFYPQTVQRRLRAAVAQRLNLRPYLAWSTAEGADSYQQLLMRTLFMGLSDGARLDLFRRANAGVVSHEQVVLTPQVDARKWADLHSNLQRRAGPGARFVFVYLVDDFTGSGRTCLRRKADNWEGKIVRFWDSVASAADAFEPNWTVCVHHYIGTEQATHDLADRESQTRESRREHGLQWFPRVEFSLGMVLRSDIRVSSATDPEFFALVQKYYDESVHEDEHTEVGGTDLKLGFAGCALPLVLEHNTPNNAVALLWQESGGSKGHRMRPLFRRRQRHT